MKRRKFYTFISLFGISLTLTILIILSALLDSVFAPTYPEVNRNRTLYAQQIQEVNRKEQGSMSGPMSRYLVENYVKKLPTPEKIGMISTPSHLNTYLNGRRGKLFIRYTDVQFWQINGFEFLEGKAFTEETLEQNDNAIIISEDIRDRYFGKSVSVLGQTLNLAGTPYRISGVVKGSTQMIQLYSASEIYLPITADKTPKNTNYQGSYISLLLAKEPSDMPKIQAEFDDMIRRLPIRNHDDFKPDTIVCSAYGYMKSFFVQGLESDGTISNGLKIFFTITLIFAFLFMLLPALNLVNLNISRIMERASEIGIRKAFGASTGTLTVQFIIENVILTVVGGAIALLLSGLFITYINRTGIGPLPSLNLSINWFVVLIALILSFIFGLMSGVLPAFKMAKLPIVEALKN